MFDNITKFEKYAAVILQLAMIPLVFLLPIYTDEIAYKLLLARGIVDGFISNTLSPQCLADSELNLFFLFIPFRLLESLIFSTYFSPMWIRVLSCLNLAVASGLISYLAFKQYGARVFSFTTFLLMLGVTPFVLGFSRPEFSIFLILMFSFFAAYFLYQNADYKKQIWLSFSILFLFVGCLAYHLKSLLLMPLFFLILLFAPIKKSVKISALILLFLISFLALQNSNKVLNCSSSPETAALLQAEALTPSNFIKDPARSFEKMFENLSEIKNYHHLLVFYPVYMSAWLPPFTFYKVFASIINSVFGYMFLLLALLILIAAGKSLFLMFKRQFPLDSAILLGIIFYFISLAGIQIAKNAYEPSLLAPLFVIASIISIHKLNIQHFKYGSLIRLLLMIAAFASVAVSYNSFNSYYQNWTSTQPLQFQKYSFTMFQYYEHQKDANDLYKTCDLPEDIKDAHHLVLDDVTYGYFYKSQRPLHVMYLTDKWGRATEENLKDFLKSIRSSGILTRCADLPAKYQEDAIKNGLFCCHKL